ncbi:MAG: hypothetical protein IKD38_03620 [Bacteroidaceae bacterium]|nr:hypothetical protein [Bacteroidaceae bacterium]
MFKKIILTTVSVLLGGYIIFVLTYLAIRPNTEECKGTNIEITGDDYGVLTNKDIEEMLSHKNLAPTGRLMTEIDCSMIENAINEYSLIDECQCYKTHKNLIGIRINCKKPIMQVFDKHEKMFYIDHEGNIIEGVSCAIYLPVASGFIDRSMAGKELLKIATFLQENRFWNEQIEQIYFTPKGEAVLIPRVGNHTIEIGKAENIDEKLHKLKEFYTKGLNKIGWNKYNKLNIEFDGQIIGTKR